ncbi:MAG: NYN domain-containing protein [Clostridia bacterium]|nr:NYN domain-containing protein [Clostridia bacterium]
MQNEINIALFIDVDNCGLTAETFNNAIAEVKERGNLVYGKVYGLSDRKHTSIITTASNLGFDTATVMRNKKRGKKDFDQRIFIDVMETVLNYNHIDTVCIISAPTEMVYFYSKLHQLGVKVIALDNVDDDAVALIDDVIDIGMVEYLKPITQPKKESPVQKEEEVQKAEYSPEDEKLLGEIKQLLSEYDS